MNIFWNNLFTIFSWLASYRYHYINVNFLFVLFQLYQEWDLSKAVMRVWHLLTEECPMCSESRNVFSLAKIFSSRRRQLMRMTFACIFTVMQWSLPCVNFLHTHFKRNLSFLFIILHQVSWVFLCSIFTLG